MPQRFLLDRGRLVVYLGLVSAGCAHTPVSLVPDTARPATAEQAATWARETTPGRYRLHRFKWSFRDERATAGGRGSARIAPPDSIRIDVAGPFGADATAAMVIGDVAQWTDPEDAARDLLPNYPLMWAMFGVAQPPEFAATPTAYVDEDAHIWQYTSGADTVQYARIGGEKPRFVALVRHAGDLVGRAEARLAPDGTLNSAQLVTPKTRLDLHFYRYATPDSFPADTWHPSTP